MELRVVPLTDVGADDLARWRRLADEAIEPNPNADPRFLHTSIGHGLFAEDVHLAIVESGDRFHAVLPFTREGRIAGVRVPHLTTSGEFMFDHASKNHPLVSKDDPRAALAALFVGLRRHGLPDLIEFTVLPADGPLSDAIRELAAERKIGTVTRTSDRRAYARREDLDPENSGAWMTGDGSPVDYPLPHLSARTRKNLAANVRRIEALGGGPLTVTMHDDDLDIIDEFLDLQAQGWKGDGSKSGPQFRRRGREKWFRAVTDAYRADGHLRVLRLSSGAETVYLAIYLISGGRSFGFHDVYDEKYLKSSPGMVGRIALMGHELSPPDAAAFDPGMEPTYAQASIIFPSSREHVDLLVGGRSLRSRAVIAALPLAKRLRDRLRPSDAAQ